VAAPSTVLDIKRLDAWIADRLPGDVGRLELTPIIGGASNEIYEISRGREAWILRRPPHVPLSPTAHNVAREYRILTALEATAVPHPRALLLCEDPSVIGASFVIMAKVAGFVTRPPRPAEFEQDDDLQLRLGFCFMDALAELWRVDWREVGLQGYGRPEGFLERQVDRWLSQFMRVRTRDVPHLEEVAGWLREHRPATQRVGVVHGDYHTNNLIYHLGPPLAAAAIVDWEQSTVGDPLVDLGWGLSLWEEPGESSPLLPSGYGLGRYPGIARRRDLAEHFARLTGADLHHLAYYQALGLFKLACILEGSYYRYLTGESANPHHKDNEEFVPRLVERARATIAGEL
jgi:aminoglycoside phosphotransferase (APT) family kinase protein